jgi:anti-sigma-K factor RskA
LKHERLTEEVQELAALYALGALTQHEARSFEIHLRDCPVCKLELNKLKHAVTGIGLAADEVAPPEYLRDILITRIDRESPEPVSTALPAPNEPARNAPSPIDDSKSKSERPGSAFGWPLRIVFIVLIVASLLALYKLNSIRETNARLQTQLSNSETAMDDLRKKLEDQKHQSEDFSQILEVTGKPGVRVAWLSGQSPAPSSAGTFFWDTKRHQYLLMGSFPPVPQGKAFQLWLVTPAKKISAGLIQTNPFGGEIYTTAPIAIDSSDVTAVGITLEPDRGSPSPTTNFYALGQFH